MSDDYRSYKARADEQYQEGWEQWWNSMDEAQREELRRLGLDKPVRDSRSYATGLEHDASEDAHTPFEDGGGDDVVLVTPPAAKSDEDMQDNLRIIVSGLVASQNIRVDAVALAFASGLTICSLWGSQSEASRRFGIMRQHLNKAVRKWRDMLIMPPNPYTSSEKRRQKLSEAQKEKHWRRKSQVQTTELCHAVGLPSTS